jgi:excisionase family DNA binding protein
MIFSQEFENELRALVQSSVRMVLKETQPQKVEAIQQPERFLTIQEASEFLSLSVPTIYSKVSKGELPVMKRSKRLYFSNSELLEYLKKGRKKTSSEIQQEVDLYLSNNKKGLNNDK